MRRRILQSILAVVIMTALLLGVPLIYTAWLWVEDVTRSDLRVRLDRMAAEVIAQEGTNGLVEGALNTDSLKVLTPNDGRLVVVYPTVVDGAARVDVGEATVKNALVESLAMGTSGSLRLEVPSENLRTQQKQAVMAVGVLVLLSITAGTVVAVVTARRLPIRCRMWPTGRRASPKAISGRILVGTTSPNSTACPTSSMRQPWRFRCGCNESARWLRTSRINCAVD